MNFIEVDGKKCRIHQQGSGDRALVYLHSAFGEGGALPLFSRLAAGGLAVTALEIPGFGESDPAPEWNRIEDAVFHLRRTLDALEIERAVVVGSSFGGWFAAELAVWHPERVSALVLVDAVGLRLEGAPIVDIFFAPQEATMAASFPHGANVAELLAPTLGEGTDPQMLLVHSLKAMEVVGRIGWNPYLHDPKLLRRLHQLAMPTLVAWGADDGLVPRAHAEAYAAAIPSATLRWIERCGHLPALERPDALAVEILSFLDGAGKRKGG